MHLLLQNFAVLGIAEKSLSLVTVKDHLVLGCGGGSFDNFLKLGSVKDPRPLRQESFS